ncbi:MAG: caspase family protein [Bacteroides sp.]|nr:caspase family protein [Bacteroides sp.]
MKNLRKFAILLCLMSFSQGVFSQVKNIDAVRKGAENGDAQSQYLLGWCYGTGSNGLSQNYGTAVIWLEKAAQQGNEAAQYYLGWCYYYGHGVGQNLEQAKAWYEKAAKQGNAEAASMARVIAKLPDSVKGQGTPVDLFDASRPPILNILSDSVQFIDPSGNNAIDADEMCFVRLKVENTGTGDAVNCIAKIGGTEQIKGLLFKNTMIPLIKSGETKEIEIPIQATKETEDKNVDLYVQVEESHGFGTEPLILQVDTKKFEAPFLQIVDSGTSSDQGNVLEKMKPFTLQALLQNTEHGIAKDVVVSIELPENVVLQEPDKQNIAFRQIDGGVKKSLEYPLMVNRNYKSNQIPVTFKIREKNGKYAEDKTIQLNLNQSFGTKMVVEAKQSQQQSFDIKIASIGSEVDKNIPSCNVKNDNTFAVIIANESYNRVDGVPFAANDGRIFNEYCKNTLGIPEDHIRLVVNATLNDIRAQIKWLGDVMNAYKGEAKVLFYYAGHGIPDEKDKSAYLLPVDGYGSEVTTGYALKDLYATLGGLPSKSVTVFLDACFSGAKREGDMLASARGVAIKVDESIPVGNMVVFSAAQGDETAYPYKEQGHGMFTYFLLKKIQETKGEISLDDLSSYVIEQVSKQSIVKNGKLQTPVVVPSDAVSADWKNWQLR